jgi:hypothetical protein
METIIILIVAVLQVVLFFKVWGMCNDVARLADKFASPKSKTPETRDEIDEWIEEGNNKN